MREFDSVVDHRTIKHHQDYYVGPIGGRRCACCSEAPRFQKKLDIRRARNLNRRIENNAMKEASF